MYNGNPKRRTNFTTLPAIETLQRNVRQTPTYFVRKPRDIPFHLPHKKLLEKIEYVKAEPEPLTGFKDAQDERFRKEKKRARLQLEPIKLDEDKDKKKKFKLKESRKNSLQDFPTIDPLKVKPFVASQKEVIDSVKNDPTGGFLYMVYAVHPDNVYFTPYYLKVVPYEEVDKKNYLTISPCGVTHYTNEMVFTKLQAWEQEYTIFVKLTDGGKGTINNYYLKHKLNVKPSTDKFLRQKQFPGSIVVDAAARIAEDASSESGTTELAPM